MKCPRCNGKGYYFVSDFNGEFEPACEVCHGKGILDDDGKPMQTNEEWLRSCSTEELREFLFVVFGQGVMFGETHEKVPMFPDDEVVTVSVFDWWLKEKHK